MSIPLHDLNNLNSTALDQSCAEWGFFALTGHDIPVPLQSEVMDLCNSFFTQPSAIKNQIRRTDSNMWGFYDAELTKNRRDWKEIIDIGPHVTEGPLKGSFPQWPEIENFQASMTELTEHLHRIALHLVDAIADALHITDDLRAPFVDHTSFLRLNYYPPCQDPAPADSGFTPANGQLGISHHTDAGALTVLMQDAQPGLQVYRQGQWHTVTPVNNAVIINIGDIVQVWSNDRYQAPLHRVLANANESRISTPYFLNPSYAYNYAPLTHTAEDARYRPINWGEFRQQRSAGDYADVGQEIQISDFRVANSQV